MARAARAEGAPALRRLAFALGAALWLSACGSDAGPAATPSPTGTAAPTITSTQAPPATLTATGNASPEPSPTATVRVPAPEPLGFPLDPGVRTGRVTGPPGEREIVWGAGPSVVVYSREDQVASDPERANAGGWNCRLHVEFEGQPAVDWYVPVGTPLFATMDGRATLNVNTVANAFDYYGVDREPFLGNPDRSGAGPGPFPGPGGGMGVFVRIENEGFRVDYGHVDLAPTLKLVPVDAFLDGFSRDVDYAGAYAVPRDFRVADAVAAWEVRKGEVIGYAGDAGYSEAPHLHYAIRRQGGGALCPTSEDGFADGGWLSREARP